MKHGLKFVAAAASVLLLSACGTGSLQGQTAETQSAQPGGLQQVNVSVIPIADTAPVYLGVEKGFFAEQGLALELQPSTVGGAPVPGVVSGAYDFAFNTMTSTMVARDKGLDVRYVTNGATATGDSSKGFGAVVVPNNSDIKSPKDLAGRKVSVNALSNIGDTTIRHATEADGGNGTDIKFVEVPFSEALAALTNGQVDAAWILEPFLTQALKSGNRVVTYNYEAMDPDLDIAGFIASGELIKNKPDLVEKFASAMNKSLEYAQENPGEVRDITGTYTKISETLRAEMTLPRFRPQFDRESITLLGKSAVKYGTLAKAPNLDELLP